MERLKRSVAVAIRRVAGREAEVLAVLRPRDDAELPDVWGLPAASLASGEAELDAIRRIGRDKLGVALEAAGDLREGTIERADHRLHMRLFEARIVSGEPAVPQPIGGVTQYAAWRWAAPDLLIAAARSGSLCCRLYLREMGLGWTP